MQFCAAAFCAKDASRRATSVQQELFQSNDRGVSYSQEELFHLLKSKNVLTLDKQRKIEPGLLAKTMCVVEHMPPLLYT